MTHTITTSEDGQYILIKVKGVIDRNIAMQQNLEAHALGKKLNIHKYLVDVTKATNSESTTDKFKFANNDMQEAPGIDKSARVAVLVSPDDHSHDFIETVTRNAGLNMRIFRDSEEAMQFLMES